MAFSQSGSVYRALVTLQDRTTPAGSALFGGSLITCFADEFGVSGNIHQGYQPKLMPPIPDYRGSHVGSVWDTLTNNNSFSGIDNPEYTLRGRWVYDVGSYGQNSLGSPILTPYKITQLASSGRTVYIKDERIQRHMYTESGNNIYSNGIPVVIVSYDMNASAALEGAVVWSLRLREDK